MMWLLMEWVLFWSVERLVSANPLQGLTFYYYFLMYDATGTLAIAGFRSQIPDWFLMAESYRSAFRFGQKWHKLNFPFWQSSITCWSGGKCNCFFAIEYLGHLSQAYAITLLLLIAFTVDHLGPGSWGCGYSSIWLQMGFCKGLSIPFEARISLASMERFVKSGSSEWDRMPQRLHSVYEVEEFEHSFKGIATCQPFSSNVLCFTQA